MRVFFLIFLLLFSTSLRAKPYIPAEGELIYRQGVLSTGVSIRAEREPGISIEGAEAACVNCHRRSGLGSSEGRYIIPPITAKYLFRPSGNNNEVRTLPNASGVRANRSTYTDAMLARAIREGLNPDGRELSYLMPRFKLKDDAMNALISYLKGLTSNQVPGVTEDTLHFATIITPDADPIKRKGMLDVLDHYFASKNAFYRESPRMHASRGIKYRVDTKWQLHVWELSGPPDSWERQLHEHLVQEPVYAVISGIGGKTWAPVHQFCEHESLPCLFPNVDLPVVAEKDFYSIYFSRGVLLEAELIARRIEEERNQSGVRRVIQIFRKGDIGKEAADLASGLMVSDGLELENHVLKEDHPQQELVELLNGVQPDTAILLWLRPQDLALLPSRIDSKQTVFMSGLMGDLENTVLPDTWRSVTNMAYPLDLPDRRRFRMNYSTAWFGIQHIPIVDERIQSDTYLACSILAETLGEMLDVFVRDYLVERVEDMLSRVTVTGYYPRLGLAQSQRFASKGAYFVRFVNGSGNKLNPVSGWIVP